MKNSKLALTVVVCTLGYFVDIYDLVLFSIVRVQSLKDLGYSGEELLRMGVLLLNAQMFGLLIGGILWGVLGDRRGRASVLFGSILLYSVANLLNAAVNDALQYGILRFFAGVGLAGELGAALTLVSEIMSKEKRGYGATVVAGFGISGAVAAGWVGEHLNWRECYLLGGILGVGLLFLRIQTMESGLFHLAQKKARSHGNFFMLFWPKERLMRYLACIAVGLPCWSVVGILITFSPEIAPEIGILEPVTAGKGIMNTYIGVTLGDLAAGLLSQYFQNRRKVVSGFLISIGILVSITLFAPYSSADTFYSLCQALGFATGYWAVFAAVAAEQFGTNLRATATVSIPNFVRGAVVPLTFFFSFLKQHQSVVMAVWWVSLTSVGLSLIALWSLNETFGRDLDFIEK
jgi:MFS family permease